MVDEAEEDWGKKEMAITATVSGCPKNNVGCPKNSNCVFVQ
jgi:hypothetical protein